MAKLTVIKLRSSRARREPAKHSSRALERKTRSTRGVDKAHQRLARSVSAGLAEWQRSSRKSAARSRDGRSVDAPVNMARAFATFLRHASWARADVLKARSPKRAPAREFLARLLLPVFR
jgi:hypothetical protein